MASAYEVMHLLSLDLIEYVKDHNAEMSSKLKTLGASFGIQKILTVHSINGLMQKSYLSMWMLRPKSLGLRTKFARYWLKIQSVF